MKFLDSITNIKLDLTKLLLIPSGGSGGLHSNFEIKPKDFLRYAREDMHTNEAKGIINGICNAKRAIDCQIDEALYTLGIDFQDLPKSLESFVSYFECKDDISYKLKIIQGLNLAPGLIISKSRNLRNKLEHFYQIPTIEDTREAIDVSDLFIRSIEGKLKSPTNEFYITDEKNHVDDFDFEKGYDISFNFESRKLSIYELFEYKNYRGKRGNLIDININDPEFYGFLRLMNSIDDEYEISESFKLIAHLISHPIPRKHISVKQY